MLKTIVLLLTLCSCMVVFNAEAKMCKTKTANGQDAFMWAKDSKGNLMITKSASGVIATMANCPDTVIEVTTEKVEPRIVYQDYIEPNPRNKCEEIAKKSCDPEFGGLPLCTTNNFANFCGFCFVSTDGKVERYLNGSPYDASKSVNGVASCPAEGLTE